MWNLRILKYEKACVGAAELKETVRNSNCCYHRENTPKDLNHASSATLQPPTSMETNAAPLDVVGTSHCLHLAQKKASGRDQTFEIQIKHLAAVIIIV
jgi:hypothetical protein